jgi:D-2-hydroxyacid dehydrogenase (NADP+)
MKVMVYQRNPALDLSDLRALFPKVTVAEIVGVDEAKPHIADSDVLVIHTAGYSKDFAQMVKTSGKQLKWVHFTTSGIDGAIANGAFSKGTVVTNSAGLRGNNVSDHAFALLLFLARRFRDVERGRTTRDWLREELWEQIYGLEGMTLAIMGLGAIGQAAARKAKAFDMKVLGISRSYKPDSLVDKVYPYDRIKEALAQADAFLISSPSDAQTRDFIDMDKLKAMKKSAWLINIARGDIMVESDVVAACKNGIIAGAGIDATDPEPLPKTSELWGLENVIIAPHIGGAGSHDSKPMIKIFTDNLARFIDKQPMKNVLDWEAMMG